MPYKNRAHKINSIFLLFIAFLSLGIIFTEKASAQDNELDLNDILDKHADATGLAARIKVKTLISFGKIDQLGSSLNITILQKRPDKYRMDVHFEQGRITQSYDGEKGWSLNPFISNDTIPIEGLELEQLIESALFDGILFNAGDLNYSVEFIGEDNVVSTPSYLILLKRNNGDRLKFFIDKKDFLIKRTEASLFFEGLNYEVSSTFSDFRLIQGMTLPFVIENNNGQLSTKIIIDKVKVNEEVEDGLFIGTR